MIRRWMLLPSLLLLLLPMAAANAASRFVSPTGSPRGKGKKDSPWDLDSALDGRQKIRPGDTLWIRGGTYKRPFELLGQGFKVRLAGREGAPIQIRAVAGERVTIDGGLSV